MPELPGQFKADLAQLWEAYLSVKRESEFIRGKLHDIETKMSGLSRRWNSPAFGSYDDVHKWFVRASADLLALLDEIVKRLHTAYTNYHDAESANYDNVDVHGSAQA